MVYSVFLEVFCPDPGGDQVRLPIQKTIIRVPTKTPTSHAKVVTSTLASRLDKKDSYQLILDTALDPHLHGTQAVVPQVVHQCWSPAGSLRNRRCLLAVLTSWGQCSLHALFVNGWPEVADVSQAITEKFAGSWNEIKGSERADRTFKELRRRIDLLVTVLMCWGLRTYNDQILLVTAQRSGDIVLLSVTCEGSVKFLSTFQSGMTGVTALQMIKENVVAVGDRAGCVKLFTFPRDLLDEASVPATGLGGMHPAHTNLPAEAASSETVTTSCASLAADAAGGDKEHVESTVAESRPKPTRGLGGSKKSAAGSKGKPSQIPICEAEVRDLWVDCDNLMVSHLLLLPHALVAVKGGHLISFSLADSSVTTQVVDSFTPAGAVVINDSSIVLATQYSSEIVVATVTDSGIGCDRIKDVPMMKGGSAVGLAKSRGAALWVVCHCDNRQPEKLSCVVNFFYFNMYLENIVDILEVQGPKQNLTEWYDHLEVIRMINLSKRTSENGDLLPPTPERFDGLTLYQLRVWRWIYYMKAAFMRRLEKLDNRTFSRLEEEQPLENRGASIESLITAKHLCSLVENASARLQVGSTLSAREAESMHLVRRYLTEALPDLAAQPGPTVNRARRALNVVLPAPSPATETCTLCGNECTIHSYESSQCCLGHNVPRCSISLLQIDQVPYMICGVCGRLAHPQATTFSCVAQPLTCVFCETVLEMVEFPRRSLKT